MTHAETTLRAQPRSATALIAGAWHRLDALVRRVRRPTIAAPLRLTLASKEIAWIESPAGRSVACERGTLWLTFDGAPVDIVLEAGQSHRCTDRGRLAIQALVDAAVRLQ